jgi:hypothetical protein
MLQGMVVKVDSALLPPTEETIEEVLMRMSVSARQIRT